MTTHQNAQILVAKLGEESSKVFNGAELAEALMTVAGHYLETRKGLSMEGVDGAPNWYGFESDLWKLSEKLRPVVAARKDWRRGSEVVEALGQLAGDRRFGKGRQNIVLMLGDFGGEKEATLLGELLEDSEVVGHAIKALTKLRDLLFQKKAEFLIPGSSGWIKTAGKKYAALIA